MKRQLVLTVSAVVLAMSGGLFWLAGEQVAQAAPPPSHDPHAGVTQNWDKNLQGASRFTVLADFGGAAVRDNNTGLVWEREPDTTNRTSWIDATSYCLRKPVGGTIGWRLPSVIELASLVDPSVPSPGPTLTPGHPFLNVQSAIYWSASTYAEGPAFAWSVPFFMGSASVNAKNNPNILAWCVRGPMQESVY